MNDKEFCNELVAGDISFQIKGDSPGFIPWEDHGLKVHILEGTISPSEIAEISIKALAGGNFSFPNNDTKRISSVYNISISKPLLKPLRLEMQHCINITKEAQTKHLEFVIAPNKPHAGLFMSSFQLKKDSLQ